MKQTKRLKKIIAGTEVEFRVETELEFTGITLEVVGKPQVRALVNGFIIDNVSERFGDEVLRQVEMEARA